MAVAHAALAWLAGASVVVLLAVAIATAAGRAGPRYRWLDRAVLAHAALTALAAVAGGVSWLAARPPSDGLHIVYGAVATVAPLVARTAAQGRGPRSIGRWVAVGAAVAIGATVRSFMTGT